MMLENLLFFVFVMKILTATLVVLFLIKLCFPNTASSAYTVILSSKRLELNLYVLVI